MGVAPWQGMGTVSQRRAGVFSCSPAVVPPQPRAASSHTCPSELAQDPALGGPLSSGICPGNSGPLGRAGLPFCLLLPEFSSLHLGLPFLHHSWDPLTLGVRCPLLSRAQRAKNPRFISSVWFPSCFRWTGESAPVALLARRRHPGCYLVRCKS